ncbi:MAG TPA: ATP-binding cassette domain-containing protein [Pyrodictiaceae archaeon]|nr:ATP-binding cassette domain-containing protein [Pyrodictiaceae archaeon]HIQ55958.1 ATP-binding cassette domain-containing protein [Pyrodictium sp.]
MGRIVLEARDIVKRIGETLVIDHVSLGVYEGEVLGLVGPNAAGKTTLLRILAGLVEPDAGHVVRRVGVGYVAQGNLLLPWLTIYKNIELPLKLAGVDEEERRNRVLGVAERLGIREYLDYYPHEVSGGTARKAAIARALVTGARLLLLDEPYTGLDVTSILSLQDMLKELKREQVSMVIVSHQLAEIVEIADRVCVTSKRPLHIVECMGTGGKNVVYELKKKLAEV